ncbi:MAG: RNA methyltransferase [Deltaproteobacteria bacterium]|nr:RNA methyltransferase [Deltaproteobacteria bacterium]
MLPLEPFMLARRSRRLEEIATRRTRNLVLVLDGVHDPHNLSAVVRSSEAFGLLDLHVVESHAPFRVHSKISQGAEKWLDIHHHASAADCVAALTEQGLAIHVADAACSTAVDELPWERPLALVFGNEHLGCSQAFRRAADGRFCVPMHGFAESLNVSVAAGICLAIGVRERIRRLGRHGDLDPAARTALVEDWRRRSVRHADQILAHLAERAP